MGLAKRCQLRHSDAPMKASITFFGLTAALLLNASAMAAGIYQTDVEIAPTAETVVLNLDAPASVVKQFTLDNPPRLVIDLPASVSGEGVGLSPQYPGHMIGGIRFGRPTPEVSRVVIDLKQGLGPYEVKGSLNPPRIAIVLPSAGGGNAPPVTRVASEHYWEAPRPAAASPLTTSVTQQSMKRPTTLGAPTGLIAAPTPAPKPLAAAKEATKPTIIIDAGHGGKDTGAIGVSGVHEKNITLGYANALKEALLRTGRYKVALTRESDVYLFLKERVDVARKNKGNIFISLHADSNPNPKATGLSIYTISEQASDAESAALAAQENKSDVIGGIDLSVEDENVANILIDLAQRETRNKASGLAESMIGHMNPKIPLIANTHRFAGFRVLKAPDIPSVLVEVGFISSPDDERRVQSIEYKDKVVRSLVAGLDAYLGSPQ